MYYDSDTDREFDVLLGKTITGIVGMTEGNDEVRIDCSDGTKYLMHHEQDCCESVAIVDVAGDPESLLGSPITIAECVSNEDVPEDVAAERQAEKEKAEANDGYYYGVESETWTFYKLGNIRETVTLRWLGESNGYYSESVDFRELEQPSTNRS